MSVKQAALLVLSGKRCGAVFPLTRQLVRIGRHGSNDICLADSGVSRHHAQIERRGSRCYVTDLASANGILVNGKACEGEVVLVPDDVLALGELRLLFTAAENLAADSHTTRLVATPRRSGLAALVGDAPSMVCLKDLITRVAPTNAAVLITGETGTGKELVARALHELSDRAAERLLAVNCGALSPSLLLSELFGHERGAFTGAHARRQGQFETVGAGTLFLDEIGELDAEAQRALLRVLENGEFTRVGGTDMLRSHARILCATHRDLPQHIAEGAFREDLFHRLCVIQINLPSLRERSEDIPQLASHFLALHDADGKLSPTALAKLQSHRWPGNVRELRNVIERALILEGATTITERAIVFYDHGNAPSPQGTCGADATLADQERQHILTTLEATGWNVTRTAETLGIQRKTLYGKLKRHGLQRP